jgi:Flp pilus assembly protein TadD
MSRDARALGDVLDTVALAMMGEFESARSQWTEAHRDLVELGDELRAVASNMQRGYVELLAGDLEAAVEFLSSCEQQLERHGEEAFRSTVQCLLADGLQALGRTTEAISASDRAATISFPDDYETLAGWRTSKARSLADSGGFREAERLTREALDLVDPTEWTDMQGRAWASLGYVLASAGQAGEAVQAYRTALDREGTV